MRTTMSEKRKKYDWKFPDGAVRIVEEMGKPIAQVAHQPRNGASEAFTKSGLWPWTFISSRAAAI
jgi:hypothetical protein